MSAEYKPNKKPVPEGYEKVPPADKYLWAIYITLCVISIVEHYSAASSVVSSANIIGPLMKQCLHLGFGFIVIYLVQRVPYNKFVLATPLFALLSIVLALLVLFVGTERNNALRSLDIGFMELQSAEFVKISAVAMVALVLSRTQLKNKKGVSNAGIWISIIVVLVFSSLLISQGITNTILLVLVCVSLMIIGGVQFKKLLIVAGVFILLGGGYLGIKILMAPKKSASENTEQLASEGKDDSRTADRVVEVLLPRLIRWNDSIPKWERKIDKTNRQEQYSYIAQANGGVFGVLPGNSRESARLALAYSDYIYAIVIEDMGLVGGIVVLLLYLSLLGRAAGIASQCSRAFPMLLVLGMALYITYQALFHMAIVSGVFPVSGQPLPLISAGGTSILITSLAIGVMLSVSRFAARKKSNKKDINKEISALPEDVRAENPSQL